MIKNAPPYENAPSSGFVSTVFNSREYEIGDEYYFLLSSDHHIGAAWVDYEKIHEELEIARELNARILMDGDLFDAIIFSDKRRYSPEEVHPYIYGRADILNATLEMTEKILAPYADLIDLIGLGNHENTTLKFNSLNLTKLLIEKLERIAKEEHNKPNHKIYIGGTAGFCRYKFKYKNGKATSPLTIYYEHGTGGNNYMNKGISKRTQLAVKVEGMDVLWIGHIHKKLWNSNRIYYMTSSGNIECRDLEFAITNAYSRAYEAQTQKQISTQEYKSNYIVNKSYQEDSPGGLLLTYKPGKYKNQSQMNICKPWVFNK